VHWQRQFLHPMMRAFDAPSREECTAMREQSNTPTAALTLLNEPTFVEAARAFAVRLIREVPADMTKRLNRAFLIALCRAPDERERQLLEELRFSQKDSNEEDAWTAVTRALLNLDETITRN
jgi:hypothetical protein